MSLSKNIITNLNEKASIDWNNYLTSEDFLAIKCMLQTPSTIIQHYIEDGSFKELQSDIQKKYNNYYSDKELVKSLEDYLHYNEIILNEDDKSKNALELWKSQMNKKDTQQLTDYLFNKLYKELDKDLTYEQYNILLQKINYIENNLGISSKRGRKLR